MQLHQGQGGQKDANEGRVKGMARKMSLMNDEARPNARPHRMPRKLDFQPPDDQRRRSVLRRLYVMALGVAGVAVVVALGDYQAYSQ